MTLRTGIIGLPNSGKSTLFNALTGASADTSAYPFCTIDPNHGVKILPDPRLEEVGRLAASKTTRQAALEYVDIAGLVKGAHKGEGMGNQFLSHIRDVDLLLLLARCFRNSEVAHPAGELDPPEDLEVVLAELLLADLEMVSKRRAKLAPKTRSGEKDAIAEDKTLALLEQGLSRGQPASRILEASDSAAATAQGLLTTKPVLLLGNCDEGDFRDPGAETKALQQKAAEMKLPLVLLCARLEEELPTLDADERKEYLKGIGLTSSRLDQLVQVTAGTLGLLTFFTAEESESRAWLVSSGTTAVQGAAKIHSDMRDRFIRAEVSSFEELKGAGSRAAAREKGLVRQEGRDYVLREGDVVHFLFGK